MLLEGLGGGRREPGERQKTLDLRFVGREGGATRKGMKAEDWWNDVSQPGRPQKGLAAYPSCLYPSVPLDFDFI